MIKTTLVHALHAHRPDLSFGAVEDLLDALGTEIVRAARNNDTVTIPGVGRLAAVMSSPRRGRNLRTGEEMVIPPRLHLRFSSFRSVRETLNQPQS